VSATIPLRRIQTMTIREGPLQRLVKRVSARVETAGGQKSGSRATQREWLAPIMRVGEAAALVGQIVPGLDILSTAFQPVHPRAFRRAVKPGALMWLVVSAAFAVPLGWWALGLLAIGVPWSLIVARNRVAHLGWAATDDVVLFRSGWMWRTVTIARVEKIQAVALVESPFDRRSGMARLHVDTAGATERSHRVHIPYLSRATADGLRLRLAAHAATTAFRW
jgi:putative membrane protein